MFVKIANAFAPGQTVPATGLYRVAHFQVHASEHEVTCLRGDQFPHCRHCGDRPRFTLVRQAHHVRDNELFESAPLALSSSGSPAAADRRGAG